MKVLGERFEARVEGGITFTGRHFDRTAAFYVKPRIEGLTGGGSVSYTGVPTVGGDGEFDIPNDRTEPRIITIPGFAYAPNMVELGDMIRRFDGLLAGRDDRGLFSWTEFGQEYDTVVRRGRGSVIARRAATGFADFTARFRAPSQRFYGRTHSPDPDTVAQLTNHGNYAATAVIDVPGPHPGFTINGPGGRKFVVSQPAASGQEHRVVFRNGSVTLNGSRQYDVTPIAQLWAVPPYQTVTVTCTVPMRPTIRDTFI